MPNTLQFLGAAGTVTGSRSLLEIGHHRLLIDCGLFQGDKSLRQRNWDRLPISGDDIDAVLLTHAHLDHSGYLPRLYHNGFSKPIYATSGTTALCQILLMDAAHLEEEAAAYANKTGYSNHKPALPLFTSVDAERVLEHFKIVARDEWLKLNGDLSVRYLRAGHIIGASMIQLAVHMAGGVKTITFSGDLGHFRSPVMRGPVSPPDTDILVLESTYGNRLHPRTDTLAELATIVNRTSARGGVLVIPSFAVGRAQELIYLLRRLEDENKIPPLPVVLDSPMAAAATDIFLNHPEDHILGAPFSGSEADFRPRHFEIARTPEDSFYNCRRPGPLIVISAAGMLTGGRILHHLKARLPDPRNTVLFTGYQAEETKGRFLQDHVGTLASLRIHHQEVPLACEVLTMSSLSAHADYADMLEWLGMLKRPPERIFLNHGSRNSMLGLAERIRAQVPCTVIPVLEPQTFKLWNGALDR